MVRLGSPTDAEMRDSILATANDYPLYHQLQDRHIPRTSGILKMHPESLHWKKHFGEDWNEQYQAYIEQTAIEGNRIHHGVTQQIYRALQKHRLKYSFTPEFENEMDSYTAVYKPLKPVESSKVRRTMQWLLSGSKELLCPPERTIISPNEHYGGTPDLVVQQNCKNTVVDIKTGAVTHVVNWLQVASYAHLLEIELGIRIDAIGILMVGAKNDKGYNFYRKTWTQAKSDLDEFLQYRDLWFRLFPEDDRHCIKQENIQQEKLLA